VSAAKDARFGGTAPKPVAELLTFQIVEACQLLIAEKTRVNSRFPCTRSTLQLRSWTKIIFCAS